MQFVIQDLASRTRPGGVYLGVGPEQNFTYMAAIRPAMAIIFDIRRGNLDLQLMYKALFELSKDRADFIAMLFAKPRPAGLTTSSTADQLFTAFGLVASSEALYRANLKAIENRSDDDARPAAFGQRSRRASRPSIRHSTGAGLRCGPRRPTPS